MEIEEKMTDLAEENVEEEEQPLNDEELIKGHCVELFSSKLKII